MKIPLRFYCGLRFDRCLLSTVLLKMQEKMSVLKMSLAIICEFAPLSLSRPKFSFCEVVIVCSGCGGKPGWLDVCCNKL